MCGTFPPQRKRWSMNFYYPNYINDMWRIFGIIYFSDKNYFVDVASKSFYVEKIREMLTEHGIALSDTGREIIRTAGNAADKDLDIRRHIDLSAVLAEIPECVAVATTGEKAASVIAALTSTEIPPIGEFRECELVDTTGKQRKFQHWRMPSSSRAYPLPLEKKAEVYDKMVRALGL